MKREKIIIATALGVLGVLGPVGVGCSHSHDHEAESHEGHNHEAEAGDAEKEEHHHGDEIILEPEKAERMGVETAVIEAGEFSDVLKVTGQIIDSPMSSSVVSAPTSGIVRFAAGVQEGRQVGAGAVIATVKGDGISGGDANRTGKAALDAAKRELDRLTPLYKEGVVSAKDYNAALEAYEVASTQYSGAAASGAARTVASGMITGLMVGNGQYVEAGTPIATVSANSRLTLRADVPDRYAAQIPLVKSARLAVPNSSEILDLSQMGGQRVSASPSARVAPGYVPLFFSFDSHGKLLPQTMAEVYLVGARRSGVISVPKEAVIEQQGRYFVFVKVDDDGYEKRPVTIGANDGLRIELTDGVKPGERVVVKGAMTVKLAESGSVIPEGHSHSH